MKNQKRVDAGRKGGQTTAERYGSEHMAEVGRLGAIARVDRHFGGDMARAMEEARARIVNHAIYDDRLKCWKPAPKTEAN